MIENTSRLSDVVVILTCVYPSIFSTSDDMCVMRTRSSKAENVFFVPEIARWSYLQSKAKLPTIGKEVDNAMDAIEKDNPSLRDVLPKVFARGNLDPTSLGGLIDLIGNVALGDAKARSADVLGHVQPTAAHGDRGARLGAVGHGHVGVGVRIALLRGDSDHCRRHHRCIGRGARKSVEDAVPTACASAGS